MSATKSEIGHSLAGSVSLARWQLRSALLKVSLHPTINYEEPDPLCDLDYVPNKAREFFGTHAIVIASGFSGTHAALVLQKAEREV